MPCLALGRPRVMAEAAVAVARAFHRAPVEALLLARNASRKHVHKPSVVLKPSTALRAVSSEV
jgi:hypothetical protein